MNKIDRRHFLGLATATAATLVWAEPSQSSEGKPWSERRDLYPEGVASGDPDASSILLWTRRPFSDGRLQAKLKVEVANEPRFRRLVAGADALILQDSDWTCRALVAGLKPNTIYWYRFIDESGAGSRVGRTRTAPADDDGRSVRFAFVSCQNVNQGAQNAYRRMIWEDDHASTDDQLGFVLHLGDFIYELVWYPEDRPQGMYDRRLRDIVRYAQGEKVSDFHIPATLDDYRAVYRAYLHDPDIQDARARFPFVPMWDNHEFSWQGWQGLQVFNGKIRPAQQLKVAANQAWFEYQPARVAKRSGPSLAQFGPLPQVANAPVTRFDEAGLGLEPNNILAIQSLTGYRALRWGRHVELIITDQHSYCSENLSARHEVALAGNDWLDLYPEEVVAILDAGRSFNNGHPPATIKLGDTEIINIARESPPQTLLGVAQKSWFKDRLRASRATWKIWGNTLGTLDWRTDPLNLPDSIVSSPWPGAGYACFGGGDPSAAFTERAEIYDFVRDARVKGFVTVAGDRHSFWAGYAAKALPPARFEPVGVAFVTGSLSAPGLVEAVEHRIPKNHPLRALYLADRVGAAKPEATINLLMRHGVRAALDYAAHGDLKRAIRLSNPELAPHLRFLDMGGHGYSVVTASSGAIRTEFVCIPRPLERSEREDGGHLRYRVRHQASLWEPGKAPALRQEIVEGDPGLSAA